MCVTGMKILFHVYVYHFLHACKMKLKYAIFAETRIKKIWQKQLTMTCSQSEDRGFKSQQWKVGKLLANLETSMTFIASPVSCSFKHSLTTIWTGISVRILTLIQITFPFLFSSPKSQEMTLI